MNTSASPFGLRQSATQSGFYPVNQQSALKPSKTQPFSTAVEARWSGRASAVTPLSRAFSQPHPAQLIPSNTAKGLLDNSDRFHPDRRDRRVDLWNLSNVQPGQTVEISLESRAFDPILEVVDRGRDRVVAQNDDHNKSDRNSYLRFVVDKRTHYRVQVTSFDAAAKGRYKLQVNIIGGGTQPTFDYRAGHGLVDAAAAVAAVLKASPLRALSEKSDLWGLDAINAPEVWAKGFTGEGITVAVLDTGVNYKHKDLKDNIWTNPGEIAGNGIDDDKNGYVDDVRGWKFVDNDTNDPDDLDGHGTHVSGTIAGLNNGFGVTGVAYNAKIMPIKVIDGADDQSTAKFDQNLAAGIRYAVDNGARVLNMSLGAFIGEPTLTATKRALQYAYNAGVVSIMAAGNYGQFSTTPIEPALFAKDNLGIAVGAINREGKIAYFSNPAGKETLPFVVGPGVGVKSTILEDNYDGYSGTSMASPHVAGVVALMLSANPKLTPDQVRRILIDTANPGGVKTA